jgi:hypothetical protein
MEGVGYASRAEDLGKSYGGFEQAASIRHGEKK